MSKNNLLALICICFLGCKVNFKTEFPTYANFKTPIPAPPAPGESFSPIMDGEAAENTPECAEWTRTAGPDESLIITGENFSSFKHADEGKDSRFTVYSTNGLKDANIQRVGRDKAVITIDKDTPKWSMYLVWPANKTGYGKPIAINKTDAWWIGPGKVNRGTKVSLYGRNLSQYNDTITSNIYIKPSGGAGQWARVVKVNPYKVDFIVPSTLQNGEYEVWAHNGHGGKYGWSGPLKLTVNDSFEWTKTIFNVKDYGAVGNGSVDDTEAINKALAAAKRSPGSTVYFPRGNYMISKMLEVFDNTRCQGEGREVTVIKCNSNFFSNEAMIVAHASNVEINELSFDTNNNYNGKGSEFREEAIDLSKSTGVKLNSVKLSCINYSALRLDHSKEVRITNSIFISRKSFLGNCSDLSIDKCDFYLTNDAEMALHIWDGTNISMTNSTCRDYDNADINNGNGWGKGRFFHSAGNGGSTRNTYLENNTTYDLGVRPVGADQNSGEQFLWEGFSTKWIGSVTSSTYSQTVLHHLSKPVTPLKQIAVITKGRGLGQSRLITAVNGAVITLDQPWNVPPDRSTIIAIGDFADRIVLYKNHIDGKADAVSREHENASSGIQPYGGVFNFIADANTLTEVRVGIANWSTQHHTGIDPNYFNLFANNIISGCRWGILNALLEIQRPQIGLLGTTYRKNTVSAATESGIAIWLSPASTPLMDNFLYEHNKFLNVSRGFYLRNKPADNITNQTLYKNTFSSNAKLQAITLTPQMKLRSNIYNGFSSFYSGKPQENPIGAPFHVVEISGTVNGNVSSKPFTIWNTGAQKLHLKLKTDAKWLKITDARYSLANEDSESIVTLKANPGKLAPGIYKANLSVEAGDQIKKFTVLFNVSAPNQKVARIP